MNIRGFSDFQSKMDQVKAVLQPNFVRSLDVRLSDCDAEPVAALICRLDMLESLEIDCSEAVKDSHLLISAIDSESLEELTLQGFDLSASEISSLPPTLYDLRLLFVTVTERASHPAVQTLTLCFTDHSPLLDGLADGDWPELETLYVTVEDGEVYNGGLSRSFLAACRQRGIDLMDENGGDSIYIT